MTTELQGSTSMIMRATTAVLLWVLALSASAQTVRYIHTDALGSVAVVTDQNRNVVERREYEPYGRQLTPALKDGPGYTGHVQDAATGLTYMQQRYYDPGIGRLLSIDPVTARSSGDNFNRYSYAFNNPYRFTDPDGRDGMETIDETLRAGNSGAPITRSPTDVSIFEGLARAAFSLLLCGGCDMGYVAPEGSGQVDAVGYPGEILVGGGGGAARVRGTSAAAKISDDTLVVRGGSATGANSAEGLAHGTGTHPSGVTGFSAESANGASLCQLCVNIRHNQVGVTTAGEIRAAGGDVVSTGGRSPNHATVSGLSGEKAADLLKVQPNPVPPGGRNL